MRICLVYDCLFPWTVGGAERWYRNLAERLAAEGHEVTYLTLTQWDEGDAPDLPGVEVVAVGPRMDLYVGDRRKIGPPLRFGLGVFAHLLRRGRHYDVVHTASFPYFSLLAAAVTKPVGRFRISCDWHEVWSRDYWLEYLGGVGGRVGWTIQRVCAQVPQTAYAFSRLHAGRLRGLGLRGEVTVLTGEYAGSLAPPPADPATTPPTVVYAGRMIPEKRTPLVVDAIAAARERIPDLRGRIFGAGPEAEKVRARIAELGLEDVIELPGFVAAEVVDEAMRTATCVLQPSSREGYGMVVVEAASHGAPAIVVAGDDNAAVELVDEGVNGFVAPEATGASIADAIVACHERGDELRASTREWFTSNADRLSLDGSLRTVAAGYAGTPRP
ncbi:glycosyltransferase family 4 protein [Patulibacter sp.]|uniref:glycosyltransferase family 4 protein n=1 Tax=Patulibacter sp. TaxID=1912859 RepID=UPI00271A1B7C|nr:glycosyltransferase [Patulibacter sp.]MDO9408188.1 glycosyltransferase [Patulibacter sp.]